MMTGFFSASSPEPCPEKEEVGGLSAQKASVCAFMSENATQSRRRLSFFSKVTKCLRLKSNQDYSSQSIKKG